jgi:hypothetical protein|nr:hypothetical protein [uncultured Veillonella sp.]
MSHTTKKNHHQPIIITSANSKELAQKIKKISKQVMVRNYKLYKALENK